MNGAESLFGSLAAGGVEICFMNPGTTEIHLVAALDRVDGLRGVACLFEGVASGAADGYARLAGKPACTLFHLGPGLSNALANLHNACRARIPIVNLVGDHATFHRPLDPPLASDIEAIARPFSHWLRSARTPLELGLLGAEAVAAARQTPGRIATLIVPADAAWGGGKIAAVPNPDAPSLPEVGKIEKAAQLLRSGSRAAILLGSHTTQGEALVAASQISAATGAKLLAPFAFARMERGAGRPPVERVAYVTEQALAQLAELRQLVLVGAPEPVAFFGHPARPSRLAPEGCTIFTLADPHEDCAGALRSLANALDARGGNPLLQPRETSGIPQGLSLTPESIAQTVNALLPEGAIVIDESITSGRGLMAATRGAAPHDWLVNTGGSIGIAVPLAIGAATAAPGRAVLCLEGDGSLMYTLQGLWTAARENLPITTVVFANRSYAILKGELAAVGSNPGPRALEALDIAPPEIDTVALAKGLGVPAARAADLGQFAALLRRGLESGEPNLIEVPM